MSESWGYRIIFFGQNLEGCLSSTPGYHIDTMCITACTPVLANIAYEKGNTMNVLSLEQRTVGLMIVMLTLR